MADKKPKPIAVIYEVPHITKVQNDILLARLELMKAGFKVIVQNPQPYTSDQAIGKAKLCLVYDDRVAHADLIRKDYKALKVEVVDYKEYKAKKFVKADKMDKKTEAELAADKKAVEEKAGKSIK